MNSEKYIIHNILISIYQVDEFSKTLSRRERKNLSLNGLFDEKLIIQQIFLRILFVIIYLNILRSICLCSRFQVYFRDGLIQKKEPDPFLCIQIYSYFSLLNRRLLDRHQFFQQFIFIWYFRLFQFIQLSLIDLRRLKSEIDILLSSQMTSQRNILKQLSYNNNI
ncbi:hypothetical protein ABPG74_005435 [Tetrahymena malaccensis]